MPPCLDLGLIAVVLISAFLAMLRGFTREVLAIASWGAAAVAAFYLHPLVVPYVKTYIAKPISSRTSRAWLAAAAVFLVTLIVVSRSPSNCRTRSSIPRLARSTGRWVSSLARFAGCFCASSPLCSSIGWCQCRPSRNGSKPRACDRFCRQPAISSWRSAHAGRS